MLLALAALASCAETNPGTTPPTDQLFWPVSLAIAEGDDGTASTLYVASSNFDLRYNRGTVTAIDLSLLGDRPSATLGEVTNPDTGFALIDSFAGRMSIYQPAPGGPATVFVPTRVNNSLFALRAGANGALSSLSCWDADIAPGQDCLADVVLLKQSDSVRAENPFGSAIRSNPPQLFVTHIVRSPDGNAYLVRLNADDLSDMTFLPIGTLPADAVAATTLTPSGITAEILTGRSISGSGEALRFFSDDATEAQDAQLTSSTQIKETRALAVSSDQTRLFAAARGVEVTALPAGQGPDGLAIIDISDTAAPGQPLNTLLGFVSLPQCESIELLVIPRAGAKRDLVAVSCFENDSVLFYDDELGKISASVTGINEPYGMATLSRPNPSGGLPQRLFVTSFQDNSVVMIDFDPAQPRTAQITGAITGGQP